MFLLNRNFMALERSMAYANYEIFNVENFKAIKLNLLKKIKVLKIVYSCCGLCHYNPKL